MSVELASVWERARFVTRGTLVAMALCACGQASDGAATAPASDTASAYLALSASVQDCQDEQDACVTAAAGDDTQIAECEAAAASCMEQTQGAQARARGRLRDDAEGCVRQCRRHRDDADGGVDEAEAEAEGEASAESTRGCMGRRAPADGGACMDDFFTCLDATGVRASSAQDELDAATRDAIAACVETAHSCMMNQMMSRHRHGAGGRPDADHRPDTRGAAGEPAVMPRGPRAQAGADADTGRSGFGDRGDRGAAGAAPTRHRPFGSAGAGGS